MTALVPDPHTDAQRWRLPECVTRIERDGRVLLFNALVPAWFVTNANGALLLSLCDGVNTLDEIAEAYLQTQGQEHQDEVRRFFQMAWQSGIFQEREEAPVVSVNQRLCQVQLSVAATCNLRCRYCYATDRREGNHPLLTLSDYKHLIDDILTISPHISFSLTGGEPLVNADCIAIGAYIRERGCEVDLLTNATLISEQNIDDIARTFYRVSISIDGSTAALHDSFRGRGAHERAMRAIRLLENRDVDYALSMTVNRHNINDVEAMAHKYGRRLTFQPLFPAGNAKQGDDISITGRQYYEALRCAHGVNPLGYCESTLDESRCAKRHKCAIGGAELSVSPTGDVYPCQLLHYPEFLLGNVHEQPLSELYRTSDVVRRCAGMTVDRIEGCRDCFLRYVCGGACRARAYHECGDIMTSGSFCEYEREAFIDGILRIYSHNGMDPNY